MKASWKRKWLAALRSGEYKRAEGRLKRVSDEGQESFCCLGVLCDISDDIVWTGVGPCGGPRGLVQRSPEASYKGAPMPKLLSNLTLEKFELTHAQQCALAKMNDAGHSFNQIADYIEKFL